MRIHKLIIASLLLATATLNAENNFLKVINPGIDGTSTNVEFNDQIEVVSYSFYFNKPGPSDPKDPKSVGPASLSDITFTGFLDAIAMAKVSQSCVLGTKHGEITLSSTTTGEQQEVFLRIILEGCYFTSMALQGSSGDQPIYEFSVAYDKITIETIEFDPRTGDSKGKSVFTYDRTL